MNNARNGGAGAMRRAGKDKARKTCVNRRGSLMGLRPWAFDLPT